MAWFPELLTPLQRKIVEALGDRFPAVFLTGGTALGAAHLGHRRSLDLDLFTRQADRFVELATEIEAFLRDLGLKVEARRSSPRFRRLAVSDPVETVPVDLVLDTTPQVGEPVRIAGGLSVDSLADIAANKLAAILGRSEERDYVDLWFLERAGVDLIASIPAARRKDAGLEAATLAFVLSEVRISRIPDGLVVPLTVDELQRFVDDLRIRLARLSFPGLEG